MDNLRIIADDLGLAPRVNEGVIRALTNHWIDGASLMPVGDAFLDAIQRLMELPNAHVGVHVVLVEEKPLSRTYEIKSLCDKDGLLWKNHRIFFIKYILGQINLKEIEKETRLQIEKCISHGVQPEFINSHQHLHLLPSISDIFIKLAKEYHIPEIRIVSEPIGTGGSLVRLIQSRILSMFSYRAKRAIDKSGLKRNDVFVGFSRAGNLSDTDIAFAKEFSKTHPALAIELGCHPGLEDAELQGKYKNWGGYHWKQELEVLAHGATK